MRQTGTVTSLLLGLLLVVGVAVAVIVMVALPHLREGSPVLAPEGERLAEEARRRVERAAEAATSSAAALKGRVVGGADAEGGPATATSAGTATPAGPPRQVASAAATPAPGTPLVTEPGPDERRGSVPADRAAR
jgi:hypothetical protein